MGPPASASLLRSPQRGDGAVLRPAEQSGDTCPGMGVCGPTCGQRSTPCLRLFNTYHDLLVHS